MTRKALLVFLGIFIAALLIQGITWTELRLIDDYMWANQAEYVATGDVQQFDATRAYGHPGAPIIDGTIFVNKIFGLPYFEALVLFLALSNGLVIGSIAVTCHILRPKNLWWVPVAGMLALNRLYEYGSPPSVLAPLLLVLLSLLTLWIYENHSRARSIHYFLWGITGGLATATRADISTLMIAVFLFLLLWKTNLRKVFVMGATAILTFITVNPFMWYMPITHMKDLVEKAAYHYAEFEPYHIPLATVLNISSFLIVSMVLSFCFLLLQKKLPQVLPFGFLYALYILTAIVYATFLTAHYQATRYFLPIIFIWETFLPLFLFSLIGEIHLDFLKTQQGQVIARRWMYIIISALLIGLPLAMFINALLLDYGLFYSSFLYVR